jgi:hypothetical protein
VILIVIVKDGSSVTMTNHSESRLSGVAQGDSLAIVGWLIKFYYHVQQ